MTPFALKYNIDVTTLEIEVSLIGRSIASANVETIGDFASYLYSCQPAYKNLFQTVQVALTIAVTSAECKRSFSCLKRIKTRLRTTMGEERLPDLALLSIESNAVSKYLPPDSYNDIIDDFASLDNNRRIALS